MCLLFCSLTTKQPQTKSSSLVFLLLNSLCINHGLKTSTPRLCMFAFFVSLSVFVCGIWGKIEPNRLMIVPTIWMIYACWSGVFCERLSVDSIVGLCLHHTHALALWNCWPRDGRSRPDGPTTTTDAHFGDPRGHRPVVDFYLLHHLRRRRHRPHCATVHRAAPEHFAARGHYCCDGGASAAACSLAAVGCPGCAAPVPSSGSSWACGRRST